MSDSRVEVLIPSHRSTPCFAAIGLLEQTGFNDFCVTIRDEGDGVSPSELLFDALSTRVEVRVIRDVRSHGLMNARYSLYRAATHEHVVWLDSDVVLHPTSLRDLAALEWGAYAAVQGAKHEVYPSRTYCGEINRLGSTLNNLSFDEVRALPQSTSVFCDMAVCLMRLSDLRGIPWDSILHTKQSVGGEDSLISGLLCHLTQRRTLLYPRFAGRHLHRPATQWKWEPTTDMWVADKLRANGVPDALIAEMFSPA